MNSNKTYIGAALVAVAAVMFWMLALPAYDQVTTLRSALADRNSILDSRTTIVDNIKNLTKQYTDRASDIQRFSYLVPPEKEAPEIVSTIQAIASQNGLTLTGLSLSGGTVDQTKDYQTQPIQISLSGDYLSFRNFLAALESNLRIMDVISLNISQTAEDSQVLNFQVKANAYYLQ